MHHSSGKEAVVPRRSRATQSKKLFAVITATFTLGIAMILFCNLGDRVIAQAGPTVVDSNLAVRTVISDLVTPTSIAFPAAGEIFVLEKQTGQVKHIVGGSATTVLDLAVNNASERGLLGITLDPNFATNHFVYLYWTCQAAAPPEDNPFFPTETECPDQPQLGEDAEDVLAVPLLGNRVDRFVWNGTGLTWERNLIKLRAFQTDAAPVPPGQGDEEQAELGNHDGGIITFGPDGKLYIIIGDVGRRGQLQNLPSGPTETGLWPVVPDDQFGGPQPDNAHFTGVIIRLNSDGTTPPDNPFFSAGAGISGEVGENIQRIFAYGVRNSFGMAFDPVSGHLWDQQNGDDSFDELNRVVAGSNLGWIQIMGPVSRIAEFKQIEVSLGPGSLQQLRWPPTRIADTPQEALSRLFILPGAEYSDPEFSWKFALAPAAIGFLKGRALGPQYRNDLFVGASRPTLEGGYLFHFNLTGNRRKIGVDDPRLEDRVADNLAKFDITESESLLFGRNFGIVTDIETGPNGNLFVVSLTNGAIYEIHRP